MKVRQTTVCHTCRSLKLACDGKLPHCSQCVHRGRQCAGYKHDLIFVCHSSAARGTPHPLRHPGRKSRAAERRRLSPLDGSLILENSMLTSEYTWDILLHVIAAEYAPDPSLFTSHRLSDYPKGCVCGMWLYMLRILPRSSTHTPVVTAAVTALGATILSKDGRASVQDHQRVCIQNSAIRFLARGLRVAGNSFTPELSISIMCLVMMEALAPTCSGAWQVHAQGASELLRLCSPETLATGVEHTIFLACRALAIYRAILNHKSTFFSSEPWKTKPFAIHSPSEIHQLLSIAAPVGALLEQLDALTSTTTPASPDDLRTLRKSFTAALAALGEWCEEFFLRYKHVGPLYWNQQMSDPSAPSSERPPSTTTTTTTTEEADNASRSNKGPTIWFPNILIAGVLAHLGSFRLIILTSLMRLDAALCTYPSPAYLKDGEGTTDPGCATKTQEFRRKVIQIATFVAGTVPYHTQPGAGFYGLTAAVVPLKTAWDTFILLRSTSRADEEGAANEDYRGGEDEEEAAIRRGLAACKAATRRLEARGYPFRAFWGVAEEM